MKIEWIGWTPEGAVRFLDQTLLPKQEVYKETSSIDEVIEAIQALRLRGAPLIGISAAMGLAAAAAKQSSLTMEWVNREADKLAAARPTAVNLVWAVEQMREKAKSEFAAGNSENSVVAALRKEAQRIWDEDVAMCRAIGEAGAELLSDGNTVMTHCNAGALATGGIGTALAPVYVAFERGVDVRVISCETRPLRQGARITSWELAKADVPVTSIVDSAAAVVMAEGKVDMVITGSDRMAANGDAANKIGTYGLSVLAKAHNIPVYIALPRSTIDSSTPTGDAIPIEERGADEVSAAPGANVYNPAFDVTPAENIAGIITDKGLLRPPYKESISDIMD